MRWVIVLMVFQRCTMANGKRKVSNSASNEKKGNKWRVMKMDCGANYGETQKKEWNSRIKCGYNSQ